MNCNNGSFTNYAKQDKSGWYLLVWNKETNKIEKNFDYKNIQKIKGENITTTALNYLKKDGLFHTVDTKNVLKYEITLLFYQKKKVTSRYIMKYKEKINAIDGYYDGWEYTVKNENGVFGTYDKDYTFWEAHKVPLSLTLFQIFCILCLYIFPEQITIFIKEIMYKDYNLETYDKYYNLLSGVVAFVLFIVAIINSTFTIIIKDLIKLHYLKDNQIRIIWSIVIFEMPVLIATLITAWKISQVVGGATFNSLLIFSIIFMIMKTGFTYFLEIEKRQK
ncbi:hypothetical protein ABHP49_005492 [Bacillus cereus]|uniref:hypothetical protein n=1 Tax=Bacillus TaxID=1386 RepID=UPI0002790250|nr:MULTISPECIES: hypothetical protein [Bacillus]HDR3313503.1 hypothetical protein [Bacillus thuringiensis]ANE89227.1 hypothetical protein DA68_28040 [Bacillus cereus]EJQ01318.1 hypothetical protein IE1_05779 [Bacillus cereus BAG3O-2]EJQ18376.1 hypothetical protein IE7_05611 [Bacillus cereus BAG4O-1]MDA2059763.1 hypothetical protein [Bacillus cereus]